MIFLNSKQAIVKTSIVLGLIFALNSCCSKKNSSSTNNINLLKVCPEEWIQNKMPSIDDAKNNSLPNEYFILDGKRRELKEFDLEWVKQNCNIKPQIVQ